MLAAEQRIDVQTVSAPADVNTISVVTAGNV
jgi:hypothetical protein